MRYNVLKSFAARVSPGDSLLPCGQFTLCCACGDFPVCVAVMYLTLRTGFERHGRKNPLSYSYFRSCRRSLVCVRLSNKGKVGVQRGRKTAGCPSFLPLRRMPHVPAFRRAQIPLNRRRKPRFNIDFTRKHTLYLNLTNSRFCILQNFRKIIL